MQPAQPPCNNTTTIIAAISNITFHLGAQTTKVGVALAHVKTRPHWEILGIAHGEAVGTHKTTQGEHSSMAFALLQEEPEAIIGRLVCVANINPSRHLSKHGFNESLY